MISIKIERELTEEELDGLQELLKEEPPEDEKNRDNIFLKEVMVWF